MQNNLTIPFYKISPSGNITLLFEGLDFSQEQKKIIASQGLKSSHLGGEQAGFIDIEKGILHMAGGEFCANATRSLALLMALQHSLKLGEIWQGSINTSGFDAPLSVQVHCLSHAAYHVTLYLPLEHIPEAQILAEGNVLMPLPGIDHLLIDAHMHPFDITHCLSLAQNFREKFNLGQNQAAGCIWWNKISNSQEFFINPVVMVPDPFTHCHENACGSGTIALALYLYSTTGQRDFIVHQPGGILSISIDNRSLNNIIGIGGNVSLVASGQCFF